MNWFETIGQQSQELPAPIWWALVAGLTLILALLAWHVAWSIGRTIADPETGFTLPDCVAVSASLAGVDVRATNAQQPATSSPTRTIAGEQSPIDFEVAGLGTRYVAWFVDQLLLAAISCVVAVVVLLSPALVDRLPRRAIADVALLPSGFPLVQLTNTQFYRLSMIGLAAWGLASIVYFGMTEAIGRGQSPGKRLLKLRVVGPAGGPTGLMPIVVRNVVRSVDQVPLLWWLPFVSREAVRIGDVLAGTRVVSLRRMVSDRLRERIATSRIAAGQFDAARVRELSAVDVEAIEQCVTRWNPLTDAQRDWLSQRIIPRVCRCLATSRPDRADAASFLVKVLAARYAIADRDPNRCDGG